MGRCKEKSLLNSDLEGAGLPDDDSANSSGRSFDAGGGLIAGLFLTPRGTNSTSPNLDFAANNFFASGSFFVFISTTGFFDAAGSGLVAVLFRLSSSDDDVQNFSNVDAEFFVDSFLTFFFFFSMVSSCSDDDDEEVTFSRLFDFFLLSVL